MSRQPLIFKLVAEPSDPLDVSREGGPSEVADTPVAPVRLISESTAAEAPVPSSDLVDDRRGGTDIATSDSPAPASALTSEPLAARVARTDFTSELPPSLRARASGLGLDTITVERDIRFKTHPPAAARGPSGFVIGLSASVLVALAAGGYFMWVRAAAPASAAAAGAATGLAQFDSQPSGATVVIDGTPRGTTPLKLTLPVGAHSLEIRNGTGSRTLPLSIEAGVLVSQYVELLAPTVQATAGTGRLDVSSDPPGAQVRVDGEVRGVTPLTLDRIDAREHRVALSRDGSTIYRTVRVAPGATASVVASLSVPVATTGAVGGYLSLAVPFEVQVFEDGKLVGSSRTDRVMMPTGRHDLELVNTSLQYRAPLTVTIDAGKVVAPDIAVPTGTLSVNALPWAEVSIDGRGVGTTPLANLSVAIGTHDIVWRHPQLGERRQSVTVTTQAPVRAGVNFSQ